ncbi:hypothetical protein OUZ56_010092 [Daphnia magna]|uniref:Uncharacterized protein n=1 Tax=Daphnia magna TaxID=35525 RepID=A0ABR0AHZ5_9CRUS|nr:hypothetical protein OUZ56_010092 [Daphnia magna]
MGGPVISVATPVFYYSEVGLSRISNLLNNEVRRENCLYNQSFEWCHLVAKATTKLLINLTARHFTIQPGSAIDVCPTKSRRRTPSGLNLSSLNLPRFPQNK